MVLVEDGKETERGIDIAFDQGRDNIIQDLHSAFPDVDFRIQLSPSYLTTHCPSTHKSIFCFQKVFELCTTLM